MKLKGKVALITGASRGIGRGIAEVFADEGADVAVNYVASDQKAEEVADAIRKKGRRAITVKADVATRKDVEPMIDKVWKELGPLDMLVNNAGIETIVPFLELTDEQWTRLVDVNLRGAWLCSQVFCRRAIAEGRKGSIVNIGSIQAAKVLPGRTHYAPTKLGLEALTRNMSAEVTPQGIRVNCVHPGLIDTDMTEWVMKSPDILPLVLAQISLGRAGEPREIGTVAAFFASDEASYLTGQSDSRRRRLGRQMSSVRLIDLSMEVYQGMMTYPNVAKPVIVEMETYSQMAKSVGTDQYGVNEITNHCMIVTGDHIGTHIDSWGHVNPDAPRAEGIPIEYCYGDGVVLDLTHMKPGDEITPGRHRRGGAEARRLPHQAARHRAAAHRCGEKADREGLPDRPSGDDEGSRSLRPRSRRQGDGHRCHRVRSTGGQDVRAAQVLGGAPRDARARVLPPREHVQPARDSRAVSLIHRQRAAREMARRLGRSRSGGRDCSGITAWPRSTISFGWTAKLRS